MFCATGYRLQGTSYRVNTNAQLFSLLETWNLELATVSSACNCSLKRETFILSTSLPITGKKMPAFLFCRTESTNKKSRHSNFTHTALTNNVYILSEDQQVFEQWFSE